MAIPVGRLDYARPVCVWWCQPLKSRKTEAARVELEIPTKIPGSARHILWYSQPSREGPPIIAARAEPGLPLNSRSARPAFAHGIQ